MRTYASLGVNLGIMELSLSFRNATNLSDGSTEDGTFLFPRTIPDSVHLA